MAHLRTRLAVVIAAGLIAVTATAAAANSAAPAQQPLTAVAVGDGGIQHLPATFDLQPYPSGTWANTGLEVILPSSGTYNLDVDVRGALTGTPPINAHIVARLWNVTAGTAVPLSERIVVQILDGNVNLAPVGNNATAPISERITVLGPTIIRLEAKRTVNGSTTLAGIYSTSNGYTSFRYEKVAN